MRVFVAFLILFYSTTYLAQTEEEINAILFPWIELAQITTNEAQLIREHLMSYGFPQVAEESWSIEGLNDDLCLWLAQTPEWKALCIPNKPFVLNFSHPKPLDPCTGQFQMLDIVLHGLD